MDGTFSLFRVTVNEIEEVVLTKMTSWLLELLCVYQSRTQLDFNTISYAYYVLFSNSNITCITAHQ